MTFKSEVDIYNHQLIVLGIDHFDLMNMFLVVITLEIRREIKLDKAKQFCYSSNFLKKFGVFLNF